LLGVETVGAALGRAQSRFFDSASARADGEVLLAHTLGRDRAFLIAHPECELADGERQKFETLVERRAQGVPVAYLIGSAGFFGRQFTVNEHVLIPRPETELLVEAAIAHAARYEHPFVLDVGTGSGAIACTIAAEVPHATVYATDSNKEALAVAKGNARALALCNVIFECGDLLPADAAVRFDCIVANLPYIPTADLPKAPDPVSYEPREALDGGPDGLREYRRLLEVLPSHVNPGALILLEAAPPTISGLLEVTAQAFPSAETTIGFDYAGLRRYVAVRMQS
jgi:release factor glutamine methyltransferase